MVSRDDSRRAALGAFVMGVVLGGAVIWYLAPSGPNAGPKTTPEACLALDADYGDMIKHMLDIAPLSVQLRNAGAFNPQYVDVPEGGPGGVLYVDDEQIDAEWNPIYDELVTLQNSHRADCRSQFPDEPWPYN